jgi:energy-coupling factor transporter ATP-binding protein EcfA2
MKNQKLSGVSLPLDESEKALKRHERQQIELLKKSFATLSDQARDRDLKEFLKYVSEQDIEPATFIIPNFAQRGAVTMYYGAKGCGKSTFLRALMFRYLAGKNISPDLKERTRTVIYFDTENTRHDLITYYPNISEYTERTDFKYFSLLDYQDYLLYKTDGKIDFNYSFIDNILPNILAPKIRAYIRQRITDQRREKYERESRNFDERPEMYTPGLVDKGTLERVKRETNRATLDRLETLYKDDPNPTDDELQSIAQNTIVCIDNLTTFTDNISDRDQANKVINAIINTLLNGVYKVGSVIITNHTIKNNSSYVGSHVMGALSKNTIPIFKLTLKDIENGVKEKVDYVCIDYPNASLKTKPITSVHCFKRIPETCDDNGIIINNVSFDFDRIRQVNYNENTKQYEDVVDTDKRLYEDYCINHLTIRAIREKYKCQLNDVKKACYNIGKGEEYEKQKVHNSLNKGKTK